MNLLVRESVSAAIGLLLATGALAHCNTGCAAFQGGIPAECISEDAFREAQRACVAHAVSIEESQSCRFALNARCGIRYPTTGAP
jgi:hypothetical protein